MATGQMTQLRMLLVFASLLVLVIQPAGAARVNAAYNLSEPQIPGVYHKTLKVLKSYGWGTAWWDTIDADFTTALRDHELMEDYKRLGVAVNSAGRAMFGNWKTSEVYRALYINGFFKTFKEKGVEVFLCRNTGMAGTPTKLFFVDRDKQPTYEPPNVYSDAKLIEIVYERNYQCRYEKKRLPNGVVGTRFDEKLPIKQKRMKVDILKLLEKKDAFELHKELGERIRMAQSTRGTIWHKQEKVVLRSQALFREKGIGLFFCRRNRQNNPCAKPWMEYVDLDVAPDYIPKDGMLAASDTPSYVKTVDKTVGKTVDKTVGKTVGSEPEKIGVAHETLKLFDAWSSPSAPSASPELATLLKSNGLVEPYRKLIKDVQGSSRGRWGNWKAGEIYRLIHLDGHVSTFKDAGVDLYVTTKPNEVLGSDVVKLFFVDRHVLKDYVPPNVFSDAKSVTWSCKGGTSDWRSFVKALPTGVVGANYDNGSKLISTDTQKIPVDLLMLLQAKKARHLYLDLSEEVVRTGGTGKNWKVLASAVKDYQQRFEEKGVRIYFCRHDMGSCAENWIEFVDDAINPDYVPQYVYKYD